MIRTLVHLGVVTGLLLGVVPSVLGGSSAEVHDGDALKGMLVLRVSMSIDQLSRPIEQRRLLLEIENTGDRTIYLDEKRLESLALIRVFDRTGAEVSYRPQRAQSPYTKKDVARLAANNRIVWPFQVSDLTADSLDSPPYAIVCTYDNLNAEYPAGLRIDRLKAQSEPFYLTK